MANTTTTSTEIHLVVVEFEHEDGYRFWSKPMTEGEATDAIREYTGLGYGVSDYDNAAACVCTECENRRAEWDRILNS